MRTPDTGGRAGPASFGASGESRSLAASLASARDRLGMTSAGGDGTPPLPRPNPCRVP